VGLRDKRAVWEDDWGFCLGGILVRFFWGKNKIKKSGYFAKLGTIAGERME